MTVEPRSAVDLGYAFDAAALQRKLDAAFAGVARKRVVVAVSEAGRRAYAAIGGDTDAAEEAERRAVPTGCVTKLLVAALIADELEHRRLACDDVVADLLGTPPEVLGDTTVKHLLEHTHGLDDSALTVAPMRADGFVDVGALRAQLDGRRFAPPGALYSYSNVGAWLLAAVLERLHGRPFETQLRVRILDALGLREHRCEPSLVPGRSICPSMGGSLALSARDLLTFLEAQAASRPVGAGAVSVTPLPGWNALEKGICLGWKVHGDGWLGHQSIWPRASLMVRIEPQRRAALVIASEFHPAPVVAAKLFTGLLPELTRLSLPKRLSPECAAALDLGRYRGRYGCAAECWTVSVDSEPSPALRLSAAAFSTRLVPAADEIFFTQAGAGQLAFVQFVEEVESSFRYLWDGRRLLRRQPDIVRSLRFIREKP